MKKVIFFASMLLCGCQSVDMNAHKAESDALLNQFIDCQIKNISVVDDKVSDASSIAIALTNSCAEQYNAFINHYCAILSGQSACNKFRREMWSLDQQIQSSILAVTKHRKTK